MLCFMQHSCKDYSFAILDHFDHEFEYRTDLELKISVRAFDCLNITSISHLGCQCQPSIKKQSQRPPPGRRRSQLFEFSCLSGFSVFFCSSPGWSQRLQGRLAIHIPSWDIDLVIKVYVKSRKFDKSLFSI